VGRRRPRSLLHLAAAHGLTPVWRHMIAIVVPWLFLAAIIAEVLSGAFVSRHVTAAIAVAIIKLDLVAQALVRIIAPPSHTLLGTCQKCGACCRSLVGDPPALVKRTPVL